MKKRVSNQRTGRATERDQWVRESTETLKGFSASKLGLVLGSGLGDFASRVAHPAFIETSEIPHFPVSTVPGHRGRMVFGKIGGTRICVLQGRVHFYESGELEQVLYPIRLFARLGIRTLIVTNAAGGVNPGFSPGDLMMITDQINLTFEKPVEAARVRHRETFDRGLREVIRDVAGTKGIPLRSGVYCGVKGPSYETAAEIRMVRRLGADAVGMSTVNEVSLATSLGMRVAGISCITNLSTGISGEKLSHAEVTDVAAGVRQKFGELLGGVIRELG